MSDADTERDPLETLAEEFIERQRRGESPSISEYAASHPELEQEIRELFPTIVAVEGLKVLKEQSGSGRASLGAVKLERLGDFRIIREIGRGGMGIVFEAEQESLGRRVAIKILPKHSLLDPKHLKRFEREARVAAGLHHTNIVEVFGIGEQDGLHYFVMQYIRGVGLDKVISQLRKAKRIHRHSERSGESRYAPNETLRGVHPEPNNETLRFAQGDRSTTPLRRAQGDTNPTFLATCKTTPAPLDEIPAHFTDAAKYWQTVAKIGLQVAEALQYAHEQGTLHRDIKPANLLVDAHGAVWLSDFGLAKALHSEDLTLTGDIAGTLRYMSPEQFSGIADARSEVYSLGLTLYELLTLRPAYEEADRTRLISLITQSQTAPPSPRKIVPEVPRDLETIVLKAISRDPVHRYPSAGALADDLRCFLEDRPIQARRATPVERLWRWSRRNRAVAALAGTTLLSLLLVAIVAMTAFVRTRIALRSEATEREKFEATTLLAMGALDRIFERYTPNPIVAAREPTPEGAEGAAVRVTTAPLLSKEAVGLLKDMLTFFDPLANQLTNESKPRLEAAEANRRVGDIHQRLGQYDEAAAAYRRAIDIYRRLARASPENGRLNLEIAKTFNELGRLHRSAGQNDKVLRAHMEALRAIEPLPPDAARAPEARYELARAHYFLGIKDPSAPERPPHPGPPPEERHLDDAIALLRELCAQVPSNPDYRYMLALCYREREATTNRAVEILEQLARDFPGAPDYRYDLSEAYAEPDPRRPLPPGEDLQALEERYRKALAISEKLVADYPHIPNYAASEAQIYHKLAETLRRERRLDEAEQCGRKAVALQVALVNQFPTVPSYHLWSAAFRSSLAEQLARAGKLPEARSLLEEAIATLNGLLPKNPEMRFLHGMLAKAYGDLASVLRQSGQEEAASKADRQAEEHRKRVHG